MNDNDKKLVAKAQWCWDHNRYESAEFDRMKNEVVSEEAWKIIDRIDKDLYQMESIRENSCWW